MIITFNNVKNNKLCTKEGGKSVWATASSPYSKSNMNYFKNVKDG